MTLFNGDVNMIVKMAIHYILIISHKLITIITIANWESYLKQVTPRKES